MKLHHISSSMMFVNTYILMDEQAGEAAVIDPGFMNPELFTFLESCPCKVKYIIATHGHGDHVGLIGDVKKRFGGEVAIHEADAHFLTSGAAMKMFAQAGLNFENVAPDILLKHGDHLKVGSIDLEVIHTPGHTKGGICLKAAPYLFTGDTLFFNDIGRTDFEGGSMEEMRHSLQVVLASIEEDLEVLPGHEDFSTLAHEKANNPYFKAV
ncbi:MAG: MBL fold metallo-hydrolase [Clostridia bacterium]|nr:MBL fold metallo-hydrolase [Clostridia bacterium]MBQ3076966.1 MBL fold metallo-hydrolase [Clostridia bacterium]